jgi:hypothetical protein
MTAAFMCCPTFMRALARCVTFFASTSAITQGDDVGCFAEHEGDAS